MDRKLFDRAGYAYMVVNNPAEAEGNNYISFAEDGTPIVIRDGKEVKSTLFTDGNGRWAKLINSTNPEKVAKVLKKKENPAIALKEGEIVCQLIPLTGIKWHDDNKNIFWLISKWEKDELEADNLPYLTAESNGTYESIRYEAYDGQQNVAVPKVLYNENNRRFQVGVNFKALAYAKMKREGVASIAVKNSLRLVRIRKAETGEFIMAHTFGAYEAQQIAKEDSYSVEYVEGNGHWEVSGEEVAKRYEFYSVDEEGRGIFIATEARYVWVHLWGDFIGCIPQWGDSMVAMSNPQVNITNPDDVYACSYIEFYGTENIPGGYIIVDELYLGAPEYVLLEFSEALAGYLETSCGIPKAQVSAFNLYGFIQAQLGVSAEEKWLEEKVAKVVTVVA